MSLSSLWYKFFGRSCPQAPADATQPAESSGQPRAGRAKVDPSAQRNAAGSATATTTPTGRSTFSFRGRGPHAGLCKLVEKLATGSEQSLRVLEIGVGDGSRAVAVLNTFAGRRPELVASYIAIDTFEMENGPIAMRDFHRLIRETGVKPQIFPMSVQAGMMRVAHTIGAVDVIVVDPDRTDQLSTLAGVFAKIQHGETIVFSQDGGTWNQQVCTARDQRRAA